MATTVKTSPIDAAITALLTVRDQFAPFFKAQRATTDSKYANYNCVFCNDRLENGVIGGRSFNALATRWAHESCVLKAGTTLSVDKKARDKAQEAMQARAKAARTANRAAEVVATDAPTVSMDALRAQIEAELRAKIEAEIDQKYAQAINSAIGTITTMATTIETLKAENAALKAVVVHAPIDQDAAHIQNDTMSAADQDAARAQAAAEKKAARSAARRARLNGNAAA